MYGDTAGTFYSTQTPACLYCAWENRESGFCKGKALEEVVRQGYMLTLGHHVGAPS